MLAAANNRGMRGLTGGSTAALGSARGILCIPEQCLNDFELVSLVPTCFKHQQALVLQESLNCTGAAPMK